MQCTTAISDQNPPFPYNREVPLPPQMTEYKVTLRGIISGSPQQFALDIVEQGHTLLHFNPRWNESRIVLNSRDANGAWGTEESLPLGALTPGAAFLAEFTDKDGNLLVSVNGQQVHSFRKRNVTPGQSRRLSVGNAERGDVQLQLVQLDVIHAGGGMGMGMGGAGMMAPSAPFNPGLNPGFPGAMAGMPGSAPLLCDQSPMVPYTRMVNLPGMVGYKVTIRGTVSHSPDQFAVDIREGGVVLLHVNPRWPENRICLNHCGHQGWGPEESAALTLGPGSPFVLEIVDQGPAFQLLMNGQPFHSFNKRAHPVSSTREIAVHKVDRQDVSLQLVQVEVLGGAGAGMMTGMAPPAGAGFQPYPMGAGWAPR